MMIQERTILLVEDNDDDAELAAMAFHRAKITNPLIRARDGVEALDYLFGRGKHAERDVSDLEILKASRANERTKHLSYFFKRGQRSTRRIRSLREQLRNQACRL